jgi:class 3 adenylate cyclase/tetratricopeptide (TPR) repeat protein
MDTENDQPLAGLSNTATSSEASRRENSDSSYGSPPANRQVDEQATSSNPDESSQAETAHVLFMDIVGFTKLPTDKQTAALKHLLEIVRGTHEYKSAQADNRLFCLPTGDGMALVFFGGNPILPVLCAQRICKALQVPGHGFGLRMGIHSGPVYRVDNIDDRPNVTGDGINTAQRVMDCGDAGHILLSNTVADYLRSFEGWADKIHDLKQVRVKNRKRVHVFNLSGSNIGNRKMPAKVRRYRLNRILLFGGAALALAAIVVASFVHLSVPQKKTIESVAILPLVSANSETSYLSSSIARDINVKLRSVPTDFDVQPDPGISIENNSRWADPLEAGRLFKAQAVVYVTNDDADAIKVRIMDARNSVLIKDNTYDLRVYGIKGVAGQISLDILSRLSWSNSNNKETLKLVAKEDTKSNEAYELYAKGRAALDKRTGESIEESIDLFNQALKEDKSFAPAYAGLAVAYNVRGGYTSTTPQENYPLAEQAAKEALRLDNTLVEAHYALGYSLSNYNYQWDEAEREFKNAINLDHKSGMARYYYAFNYLISQGMMDQARNEMEQAQQLAPESLIISTNLGWTYYYAGDYRRAIEQYKRTLVREPRFERAHVRLIEANEQLGNFAEAMVHWQAWIDLAGDEKKRDQRKRFVETLQAGNAKNEPKIYWQNYLKAMEQQASEQGNRPTPPYPTASIYAMLGRKKEALAQLMSAYNLRDESLIKIAVNPRFATLHSDRDFIKLVEKIGLKFPPRTLST